MKVFLSHGDYDEWIAKQMARCIEECGSEVFLDVNDIETGDEWRSRIKAEIINSDELVALLTPFSVKRTWLWHEIGAAWVLQKRIVAITYGMTVADLDNADGGGRGVLEGYQFRALKDFETYLHELRERIPNG
jgi:hypothetical protein